MDPSPTDMVPLHHTRAASNTTDLYLGRRVERWEGLSAGGSGDNHMTVT